MATRKPETYAKRAREQAVKERRERKQAKKDAAAAARAATALDGSPASGPGDDATQVARTF